MDNHQSDWLCVHFPFPRWLSIIRNKSWWHLSIHFRFLQDNGPDWDACGKRKNTWSHWHVRVPWFNFELHSPTFRNPWEKAVKVSGPALQTDPMQQRQKKGHCQIDPADSWSIKFHMSGSAHGQAFPFQLVQTEEDSKWWQTGCQTPQTSFQWSMQGSPGFAFIFGWQSQG